MEKIYQLLNTYQTFLPLVMIIALLTLHLNILMHKFTLQAPLSSFLCVYTDRLWSVHIFSQIGSFIHDQCLIMLTYMKSEWVIVDPCHLFSSVFRATLLLFSVLFGIGDEIVLFFCISYALKLPRMSQTEAGRISTLFVYWVFVYQMMFLCVEIISHYNY